MTPAAPQLDSAARPRGENRFSTVVSIPSPFPKIGLRKIVLGVAVLIVVMVAVFAALAYLPNGWLTIRWELTEQVLLAVAVLVLMLPVMLAARKAQRKRLKNLYDRWLDEAERTPAQAAATRFYRGLFSFGRRARAAAANAYLAEVSEQAGRLVLVGGGDQPLTPLDDGTLSEECDVLEGRTRGARRWILVAMCIPLVIQFGFVLLVGGFNPLRWPPQAVMICAPALFNLALVVVIGGYMRLPGTVVLAAPGRVLHTTVRGHAEFTPQDSVMLIVSFDRARTVAIYRRDGRRAMVQLPGAAGPGLQNLINRWCMAIPAQVQTPASATRIGS